MDYILGLFIFIASFALIGTGLLAIFAWIIDLPTGCEDPTPPYNFNHLKELKDFKDKK